MVDESGGSTFLLPPFPCFSNQSGTHHSTTVSEASEGWLPHVLSLFSTSTLDILPNFLRNLYHGKEKEH